MYLTRVDTIVQLMIKAEVINALLPATTFTVAVYLFIHRLYAKKKKKTVATTAIVIIIIIILLLC